MDFSPSVYEHAARLINRTPWEVSRDPDLLFQGHAEAFRRYNHSPVVVGIDIYNVEAEAYGSTVGEAEGYGIPAVSRHACATLSDIMRLKPYNPRRNGRLPMMIDTGKRLADAFPEADIRVPVSGPFSLASNLVGFECLLYGIADSPETVGKALQHLVRGQVEFSREIVRQGLDVAFFESAATPPLVPPETFEKIELPALMSAIEQVAVVVGHPVPCIVGGNTLPILDSMLKTGTGYVICPWETDQAAFMEKMKAHPEIMVRVNTAPGVFASGDMPGVRRELDRIMALVTDREKACIGTGALPFETPPDIVLQAKAYVKDRSNIL